jgi:hypothetical protein
MTDPAHDDIEFDACTDPLQRGAVTAHVLDAPVLGIPVRFESNSRTVIEIADEAMGAWRALAAVPELIARRGVVVRVIVVEGDEGPARHASARNYVPDAKRVIIATPGSVGVADATRREALVHASRALVADREHFRYTMLEAVTLSLLSRFDRVPFHAAALMRGDSALLLAARSGVGKSTLAYAAARAGISVLAEDLVFLQRRPRLRVWGWPGALHLPPDAVDHFPELAGRHAGLLANGKVKIALRARDLGAMPDLPVARRAGICLLGRGAGRTTVEPIPAADVIRELSRVREQGFDIFADVMDELLAGLCRNGGWRLNVAGPPHAAVPALHGMLDAIDRTAPALLDPTGA